MSHHDLDTQPPPLRYGSLFTGIEGIGLALERSGMVPAFQVELLDRLRTGVLARHWPDVPRFDDVATVTKEALGDAAAIDVLAGGFPCQDISVAGGRRGLAGERSFLWWHFARLVAELAPRWVLVENVDGLLSSNDGRDLGAIVGTLGELGYGYSWRVLDAQWFGVAQRRRRLVIVGCAGHWTGAAEVLLEPETGGGHPREVNEKEARAALRAGRRPRSGRRARGRDAGVLADDGIVSALTATDGGVDLNAAQAGHYVPEVSPTVTAKWSKGTGGPSGDECQNLAVEVVPLAVRGRDGDALLESGEPEDPMYALRAGDGGSSRAPLIGVFRKAKRASTNTDDETWEADDVSNTLNVFDDGSGARATVAIVEAVPVGVDLYNQSLTGDIHAPLRTASGDGSPAVLVEGIPIDRRNATRSAGNGDGTAGMGIGEDGDAAFTVTKIPQAVAYTVTPEGGQGADLVCKETDLSQTLTAVALGRSSDRQPLIVHPEAGSPPMSQRVATGDVVPTLTASASPNRGGTQGPLVLDGVDLVVRRLLPVECLRLQGFPDDHCGAHTEDWTRPDGLSDSAVYQAAGNAVAVPVFHWVGRRIVKAHERLGLAQLPAHEPQPFTMPEFVPPTEEEEEAAALAAEPPPSLF